MMRLVILSGCSGGGKSSLLAELEQRGYTVIYEAGRKIVQEQVVQRGIATPWKDSRKFCELLITRSIDDYHTAEQIAIAKAHTIFFDRSFLDAIAYYHTLDIENPHQYDHCIQELRFDKTVFMVPPWKEIFCNDKERKHSFEDAQKEYTRLSRFYPQHGYSIVEIPKWDISQRIEYLLKQS